MSLSLTKIRLTSVSFVLTLLLCVSGFVAYAQNDKVPQKDTVVINKLKFYPTIGLSYSPPIYLILALLTRHIQII